MKKLSDYVWEGKPLPLKGITDMHAHMGPLNMFYIPANDIHSMVKQMDSIGVERIVCSHHAVLSAEAVFGNNEVLKAMKEFPGRILGYVYPYPVNDKLGIDEVKRCIEAGMVGIKMHYYNRIPYTSEKYEKILRYADDNKLPVLLHTFGDIDKMESIFKDYKNIKFILGHSGAENPEMYVKYALKYKNLYLDPTNSTSKFGIIEYFVKNVGADRIVFGSDIPFLSQTHQIGRIIFADISEEDKKKILCDNPKKILGK